MPAELVENRGVVDILAAEWEPFRLGGHTIPPHPPPPWCVEPPDPPCPVELGPLIPPSRIPPSRIPGAIPSPLIPGCPPPLIERP
jgi:hypothetical protein